MRKLTMVFTAFLRILWLLVTQPVDIVHIHSASRASFYRKAVFIILVKFFRKKIVFHLHGGGFRNLFYDKASRPVRWFIRWILGQVDVIIVLSAQWKAQIDEIAGGNVPVLIIYNAVVSQYDGSKKRLGCPPVILYLGLVGKDKGVGDLLSAAAILKKRLEFRLVVAGNGDLEEYRDCALKLGIGDYVEFPGWVCQEGKDHLLKAADVLVLPSYNEGLPMSILEALAYGVPVVATAVGGIPDAVQDGQNGYLIEPGDSEALEERMAELISSPELNAEMRKRAAESVHQRFCPQAMRHKLEEVYSSLRA